MFNAPIEADPDPEPDIRRFSSSYQSHNPSEQPSSDSTAATTPVDTNNPTDHQQHHHHGLPDPRIEGGVQRTSLKTAHDERTSSSGDDAGAFAAAPGGHHARPSEMNPSPYEDKYTPQDQSTQTGQTIQMGQSPINPNVVNANDVPIDRPTSNRPKVRDFATAKIAQPILRATEKLVPARRDLVVDPPRPTPLSPKVTKVKVKLPNPGFGRSIKNTLRAQPLLFSIPILLPLSWALHFSHQSSVAIFITSLLAIVPLAGGLSFATEELAHRVGDAWGGLLNATFGNAVELLIAILALVKGDIDIVQASMVGSILSNVLLVLGMSYFAGGLRFHEQLYGVVGAQMHISLLGLTLTAIVLPAAYHFAYPNTSNIVDQTIRPGHDIPYGQELDNLLKMSRGLSFILLAVYGMFLTFQLWTHAYLFRIPRAPSVHPLPGPKPHHEHVFPRPNWVPSIADSSSSSSSSSHSTASVSGTTHSPFRRFRRWSTKTRSRSNSDPSHDASEKGAREAARLSGGVVQVDEEAVIQGVDLHDHEHDLTHGQEHDPAIHIPDCASGHLRFAAGTIGGEVVEEEDEDDYIPPVKISFWFAIGMLTLMTALAGVTAEFLVSSIDGLTETGNVSREFVGLVLLPVIGNSVEHITAVTVSVKDKLNLSMSIAVGSSIQVSLCILPILVLIGWAIGQPMLLFFDNFETITLVISVLLVNFAISDGRTNYLEGFILMMAYVSIALVCWFYDPVV